MPTYEYRCQQCHHQLEIRQSMHDAALTHCPHCEQETLHRLISQSSFQLKGTGYYATDYVKKMPDETKSLEKSDSKDNKADGKTTNDDKASTDNKTKDAVKSVETTPITKITKEASTSATTESK